MTDWHERYKEQYKRAKEAGKSFFPYAVFKDALVSVIILAALSYLAVRVGAKIEDLADPTDTTYNPRPEWYFLFLFQALKAFPGKLEPVAASILPGLGVLTLLLLPFLDSGPKRHPLDRPFWTGMGIVTLTGIATLTVFGFRSPLLNRGVPQDALVARGERFYRSLNCAYCHKIAGKGGVVGPALDRITNEMSSEWLKRHFRDPRSVTPTSVMPKLNLLDDEIDVLTAYVLSLGTGGPFTKEAPKLFAANCALCHKVSGKGGDLGPDISSIGTIRSKSYIQRYIIDPSQLNTGSAMPSFKGQLTDIQIEDLSRYLASLGR